MKQLAQYQDGRLELQEVPMPVPPPAGVLVRVTHSVVSAGTERMKVEQARMNLLQKARARPDQVRKVLDTARTLGWRSALEKVRNRLETPTPLGYSAAGVVIAVDSANTRCRVGDRVACGGAECAFHAEFIAVPDLLTWPVPDGIENGPAAYTTLACIALQAVRQLAPTLGERMLVLGQGLIGLLVTSVLRAHGARVLAVDVTPARRPLAEAMGAEQVVISSEQSLADAVRAWTGGFGVDGVVLATATRDNGPVEQAAAALRDRGRLVLVGNTRADLDWKVFYEKEIEVRYSRSYGPGRYDPSYEWGGADYPIGYVRWTEQRNAEAVLHLMKTGQLQLDAITTRRVPFAESLEVYRGLLEQPGADVGVLLEYDTAPVARVPPRGEVKSTPAPPVLQVRPAADKPVTRLDVIGAGNFARSMLLPHLQGRIALGTVVNATALSAQHVKTKFGFENAATDAAGVLAGGAPGADPTESEPATGPGPTRSGAAVLIATRHQWHARFVTEALRAGRHVFVEKPLCLTHDELVEIDAAVAQSQGSVTVGFNRRFAPATGALRQVMQAAPGPKSASFRVLAGRLDPQHWYANPAESGGRVLGEACHFFDFLCFVFGARPVRVSAQTTWPAGGRLPFPDSVMAQVEFAGGSAGQVIYSAEGDPSWPKEVCTVYGAGFVAEIENFQKLTLHQGRKVTVQRFEGKGHAEEMAAWLAFLAGKGACPLPYAEARASTALTLAALESIRTGATVAL